MTRSKKNPTPLWDTNDLKKIKKYARISALAIADHLGFYASSNQRNPYPPGRRHNAWANGKQQAAQELAQMPY